MQEQSLWNRGYIFSCLCNLVFCLSFHMLLPVLPLYILGEMHASESTMGIIMFAYPLAALLIRFASGRIVDSHERKLVFICCMMPFIGSIVGYILFNAVLVFILLRFIHGAAFGMAQTTVSTMAVDAIPPSQIGTGIGLFGTLNSLSMALGPMVGLLILDSYSFDHVFMASVCMAVAALVAGVLTRTKPLSSLKAIQAKKSDQAKKNHGFSLDSLILKEALPMVGCFILTAFPSGAMMSYVAIYAKEHGIDTNVGLFFTLHAAGLILSRFWSGKLLDGGHMFKVIPCGKAIIAVGFCMFLASYSSTLLFISGFILGIGYGFVAPSYQMMIILLAPEEKRGTANSTYFLAWDLAIGVALLAGGTLADMFSLDAVFYLGLFFVVCSILWFVGPIRKRFTPRIAAVQHH